MTAMQADVQSPPNARPRLLFVDDEQRVLNSMKIMFRRRYELFLASRGIEALQIVKDQDIDVIVADHRMPQMTGVEVLTAVRALSPRTVRILLTGYADLDAVEGSINEGEVFRFLTKPCAPDQLRETIDLAARLSRVTPAPAAPALDPDDADDGDVSADIILSSDWGSDESATAEGATSAPESDPIRESSEPQAPARQAPAPRAPAQEALEPQTAASEAVRPLDDADTARAGHAATAVLERPPLLPQQPSVPRFAPGFGVVLFSSDEQVVETVKKAAAARVPVHHATNIVQVVKILTEHRPGVLVTDISDDKTTIQTMTARLKQHLPELVTICVSKHRDVLDMVWLINHGQIFRFLRKPLSPGRCAVSLRAALHHHRTLLKNPELVKRHEVEISDNSSIVEGVLSRLKSVKRLWASA